MSRDVLRTVLIWLFVLGLGSAWWFTRSPRASTSQVVTSRPLAEAFPLDRLDAVEIAFADGRQVLISNSGRGWRQTEPFPVGIDAYSLRQLGTTAQGLNRVDTIDISEPGTAERLGLEPAAATVTWRWREGDETRSRVVQLGNRTLAGRAWVRLDGENERASLVDATLHEKVLETDLRFLRDRMLAPSAGPETDRVVVEAGSERMEVVRTDTGWKLLEPVRTRGDDASISDWIARIARTRAAGFLHDEPDRLDRFGLAEPVALLSISGRETDPEEPAGRTILIGDPIGVGSQDRYALIEGSPTVIRLEAETQQVLVPAAATLIDATGTGVVREDIAAIEIQTGGEALGLEREFDGWLATRDQEPPVEVDRGSVESLLKQLTEARAGEILLAPFPRALQAAIVILYGFDGSPIDTIRIARDPDSGSWALENGDDVLRIFPASFEPSLTGTDFGLSPVTPDVPAP